MAMALTRDLLERRFPQYLALYLGVCWGLIEFFQFLENRFLLSPHFTDLVLLLGALLLPSAALFIYFHGRPGADRWHLSEKVLIPANVVLTMVILFMVFSGKPLGAMTTTVTVEDEDGNAIERVVPRSGFRKRLVVFPFEADAADHWLGEAAANALVTDLYQDMFLDLRVPAMFREDMRKAGYPDALGMPTALKRRIAQDRHMGHYVDGAVARTGDGYRLTVALHEVRRARTLQTRTFEGSDFLALIDDASIQLRLDLGLPSRHIEDSPDLPVAEILTGSMEALEHQTRGSQAIWIHDDYAAGADHLHRATEADPAFATAHLGLYMVSVAMGDIEAATAAVQRAMDHIYRLPERTQYGVRGEWYAMQQDFPRSFATIEMWAELYPQDLQAQMGAAHMRLFQDDRRGAIEKLEQAYRLDPTQSELLQQLGGLHEALSEPDRALDYYSRYAELFPENKDAYTRLGHLHRRAGQHDHAREAFERALLLEPGDVGVMIDRALVDRDLGRFDDARAAYDAALSAARTPDQRIAALRALSRYYAYRGAYTRAVEYLDRGLVEADAYQPPIHRIQLRLLTLSDRVLAGQAEAAVEMVEALAAQLAPPLDALVPIGRLFLFETLERPDELEAALADARAMVQRTGFNSLLEPIAYGQARLHELRGEWRDAVTSYEEQRALDPTDMNIPAYIGRAWREAGDNRRADRLMRETLAVMPSSPRANYELALVYERMGRRADAARHFRVALDGWDVADDHHRYAGLARQRLGTVVD